MAGMPTPSARDRRTAAALALVAILVQIPFLERGISFYDEGSILAIADGLRSGETLYHDRVTTIAPLTFELMGALFGLFGPSFLVGRLLLPGRPAPESVADLTSESVAELAGIRSQLMLTVVGVSLSWTGKLS